MSPEALRHIQLPPDAPRRWRLNLLLLRFLGHHNRLDGYMAFVAVAWGALTIIFPDFWHEWPVTVQLSRFTGGHTWLVSWSLLLSGIGSYVSRRNGWNHLRTACALLAFSNWAMLALIFWTVRPIFSPGAAVYSCLAAAKLLSYLNFVLRLDQREHASES